MPSSIRNDVQICLSNGMMASLSIPADLTSNDADVLKGIIDLLVLVKPTL